MDYLRDDVDLSRGQELRVDTKGELKEALKQALKENP